MPHLVIEYSSALSKQLKVFVKAVVDAAVSSQLFNADDIKVRTVVCEHYDVDAKTLCYLHVRLHILSGRDDLQRGMLSEKVSSCLAQVVPCEVSYSVEVLDIDKNSYTKHCSQPGTAESARLTTESQLRDLYGYAKGRAVDKELAKLERHSKRFIEHSPFMLLSTVNTLGELDCSPRGGDAGFVRIIDDKTLVVADARGNNRLDSLVNIIETGRAGCLFLIPGVDETLRVNGRAFISTDTGLLEASRGDKNPAKSVIVIEIEQLYMHCAKALMRSKLWLDTARVSRAELPTMAQIINDQLGVTQGELETQEQMLARYREQL